MTECSFKVVLIKKLIPNAYFIPQVAFTEKKALIQERGHDSNSLLYDAMHELREVTKG